jgi:hypothetical protein
MLYAQIGLLIAKAIKHNIPWAIVFIPIWLICLVGVGIIALIIFLYAIRRLRSK